MSRFLGGSAYNMARDIAEGYYTTTARTFSRMSVADMGQLGHEIERYLRELRAGLGPKNDHLTNQAQNKAFDAAPEWFCMELQHAPFDTSTLPNIIELRRSDFR